MEMPSALNSLERLITQPSLLLRTATGRLSSRGAKIRSQETKKLFPSTSPIMGDHPLINWWITAVTTPKIRNSMPSVNWIAG